MAIAEHHLLTLKQIITRSIRDKFNNYNPEPSIMPFHTRLLGADRLALYSFIHSLNTNFGTSIFEPVAQSIALTRFSSASTQQVAGYRISSEAHRVIQNIMDNLSTANSSPNQAEEIDAIREVCIQGTMRAVKLTKVDLKLVSIDGVIYLIDIKTAKPNAGGFKEFKRTLLEWTAAVLADNPEAEIYSLIAIPYNPYAPRQYNRWTMRGMIDLNNELKVAAEFWDFLGGDGAYLDLLNVFEAVGIELRTEIDEYFSRFA